MKTIIAIKGAASTGKSTALKRVYELLKAKYPNATIRHEPIGHDDIRAIMEINGLKLGIVSQGDPNTRLVESLDLFVSEHCVIIVCATRTSRGTVQAVKKHEPQFHISWHRQSREPDAGKREQINNTLASIIFTEIEKLIATSL